MSNFQRKCPLQLETVQKRHFDTGIEKGGVPIYGPHFSLQRIHVQRIVRQKRQKQDVILWSAMQTSSIKAAKRGAQELSRHALLVCSTHWLEWIVPRSLGLANTKLIKCSLDSASIGARGSAGSSASELPAKRHFVGNKR